MSEQYIFAAALGLQEPWYVSSTKFSVKEKRLDIYIDFTPGFEFSCPCCDKPGDKAYDTKEHSWRHLDFFQHQAYLHARVPRVNCEHGCGIKKIGVPWARPGSGFTLLFEALLLTLCKGMPVASVAALINEHDTRIWRVIGHYVAAARAKQDFSNVKRVGMDETASRRGHDYISLFCDMDKGKLLFATEGKDKLTVKAFSEDLKLHGGDPKNITQACSDMSPAFISGIKTYLPEAEITFDRFHIMKILNEAVDSVRREEVMENDVLKNTRYIWLKNAANLTIKQTSKLTALSRLNLKTAKAYQIRLNFQMFFSQENKVAGEAFLNKWYYWATHSRIEPIIKVAKTIKKHWDGIINWFDSKLTTGLLEGLNSLIQAAKSRARGYRSNKNFINMSYLLTAKLEFDLPT